MDRNEISKYRYFDTHTHVYDPELMENFGTLNDACIKQGILIAVIGVDLATSNQAVTISQGCSNAIATAGIHPLEIKPRTYQEDLNNFQIFLTKNIQNISAIGEVGLDYHYKNIDPEIQKIVFIKMIETAIKYKKPIILHVREAYEDCFNILLNYQHQLEKILIHCYDTNAE
jgi:TatD DNase family protein